METRGGGSLNQRGNGPWHEDMISIRRIASPTQADQLTEEATLWTVG